MKKAAKTVGTQAVQRQRMLFGRLVNEQRHLWVTLARYQGIGEKSAVRICHMIGLLPSAPMSAVTDKQLQTIKDYIETRPQLQNGMKIGLVGNEFQEAARIRRLELIKIGHRTGKRLAVGLPVHGQTTKSNGINARRHAKRMNKKDLA